MVIKKPQHNFFLIFASFINNVDGMYKHEIINQRTHGGVLNKLLTDLIHSCNNLLKFRMISSSILDMVVELHLLFMQTICTNSSLIY